MFSEGLRRVGPAPYTKALALLHGSIITDLPSRGKCSYIGLCVLKGRPVRTYTEVQQLSFHMDRRRNLLFVPCMGNARTRHFIFHRSFRRGWGLLFHQNIVSRLRREPSFGLFQQSFSHNYLDKAAVSFLAAALSYLSMNGRNLVFKYWQFVSCFIIKLTMKRENDICHFPRI